MASLLSARRPLISLDHSLEHFVIPTRYTYTNAQLLQHSGHALSPPKAFPMLIEATIDATATAATSFEAKVDPAIAIAAAVAAVPPVLFWVRIALSEQRRRREAEEKESAREELKKKLFGGKRE